MKILLFTLLLFQNFTYSQRVDLRKLTLNSNIILFVERNDFDYYSKIKNDHFSENKIKIKSTQQILKNNVTENFLNTYIPVPKEGNDFYDNGRINGEDFMGVGEIAEPNKKYYSILFLKKQKSKLILLAHINRSDFDWKELIKKINDIQEIENTTSQKETYKKNIDYYLKYDDYPSYEFIEYYKNINILKSDSLVLDNNQLIVAKEKFLNGIERYYDLVWNKFPKEISKYYIQKMKKISQTENEEEISFYDFQEAYERATHTGFMDDSEMGKLKNKLFGNDEAIFEEKQKIMKTLIENAENKNYR
ncbi:hypothetical protein [Chryseobacterium turcicum]|uniref:Uncharacterized protein n=1 Tax=Chryseobacterium turcicum TaxID=2898076 RepID=A0A9Q3YWW6_9FLAO|nr:hypothetical protein [Chryseobacterium turcicum]MCD1118453.1 hypothetical protein [Chryseobacterium turcicum]